MEKTRKTQGKLKICDMIANKNVLIEFFSLELLRGKVKISWKTQGKLREFSFSKMWSSCHNFNLKLIIKAVQIVDSSKITDMIRCAWNASSMYPAFRIVPQLHSDTVL